MSNKQETKEGLYRKAIDDIAMLDPERATIDQAIEIATETQSAADESTVPEGFILDPMGPIVLPQGMSLTKNDFITRFPAYEEITMPKTLKATPTAFELECPECRDIVPAPSGSLFWTREDMDLSPQVIPCPGCGKTFKLPQSTRR